MYLILFQIAVQHLQVLSQEEIAIEVSEYNLQINSFMDTLLCMCDVAFEAEKCYTQCTRLPNIIDALEN